MKTVMTIIVSIMLVLPLFAQHGDAADKAAPVAPAEEAALQAIMKRVAPYSGTITVEKRGPGNDPQPLVTTCAAGTGESCALFASNCLAANGYYDGDNSGGVCCSGVDHPNQNPNSACN